MVSDNNWRGRVRIAVGIVALVLLLAGSAGAVTPISACGAISSSGVYVLTQNIIHSTAKTCVNITSSNVIFDGAGYTIDGVDATDTYGIYVYNPTTALTNVTVKNLIVTGWNSGIYYQNTTSGNISNNTASLNGVYGIYLSSSNYSQVLK